MEYKDERFWVGSFYFILIFGVLGLLFLFPQFKSVGKVVAEIDSSNENGFSGDLIVTLGEDRKIKEDTLILISVRDRNEIILARTITFEEFRLCLDSENLSKMGNQEIDYGIESYRLNLFKFFEFDFVEGVKYEFILTIPSTGLKINEEFRFGEKNAKE